MTEIPADIRDLLACPRCGGVLRDSRVGGGEALTCDACALVYPVEAGIPVLLAERSQPRAQVEG